MRYQFGDKNWDHAYYVLVEFWWTLGDRTLKTHSSETLCFDVPVYKIPFWVAPAPENRWFVDAWSVDYSHAEEPRVAMFLRKRLHLWLLTPLLSMLAFSVVTSRARYPIASSSQNNNCKDLSERYACIHGDKYNFFRELHANTNSNVQLDLHSLRPHVSPLAMPTFSFCFFFPNSNRAGNVSKNHGSTLGSLQGRDIQLLGKPQHIFVRLATKSQSWSNAATGWC